MDSMPPRPVPWVEDTRAGCTARSSSAGLKPELRKASTVATRFQMATRSRLSIMSAGMPYTAGSKPSGIWPPTKRDMAMRRGTRTAEPALRVTVHSPASSSKLAVVVSGSEST